MWVTTVERELPLPCVTVLVDKVHIAIRTLLGIVFMTLVTSFFVSAWQKNYHRPCLEFQDYRNPCFLEIGAFYMGTFPWSLSSENILSNYELFSKTGVQRYKEKIPTNHIMLAMNWSSDVLDQLEPYDFLHKFGSPCFYESSPSIFDQVINRRRKEKVE